MGHVGVRWSCRGEEGWVMWMGWGGSCRGWWGGWVIGIGVGWGGSCRGGVGWVM